jgi:broad specificity phosphatase PhoE
MDELILLLIRHAEKPGGPWPGPGLTAAGEADAKSLVIRGWQRAGAWAALFGAGDRADYPRPGRVFAAAPARPGDAAKDPSQRPYETALPLAERLDVALDTSHRKGDEAALVQALLGLSGVVLVAWEHKAIVEAIVPLLDVVSGTPPTTWPDDRFDVVLRFDRAAGADGFSYRMLFPMLLGGDLATGF